MHTGDTETPLPLHASSGLWIAVVQPHQPHLIPCYCWWRSSVNIYVCSAIHNIKVGRLSPFRNIMLFINNVPHISANELISFYHLCFMWRADRRRGSVIVHQKHPNRKGWKPVCDVALVMLPGLTDRSQCSTLSISCPQVLVARTLIKIPDACTVMSLLQRPVNYLDK